MKYDYSYFPEHTEITVDQAKQMNADIQAGKLTVDPRVIVMLERKINEGSPHKA